MSAYSPVVPTGNHNAGSSATPTGNISTTATMMGLGLVAGFSITPATTGKILVWVAGVAINTTLAGDGTNVTLRYGTGTAPSNAATGSPGLGVIGLTQHFVGSTTAGQAGFMCMGRLTGLTLNTAYWFDLELLAVTGGGSSVKDVQCIVHEI